MQQTRPCLHFTGTMRASKETTAEPLLSALLQTYYYILWSLHYPEWSVSTTD